jgi:hypothetical protein
MTALRIAQFAAILTTALALVPGAAHALEMPNKMRLPRIEYLIVQRLYRGWQFVGIFVVGALASTIWLAVLSRSAAAWVAAGCIAGTQVVFWIVTFPVNRRTGNWTRVADDWVTLRKRWEFSHAASAVLNLAALVCAVLAVLPR